MVCVVLSTRVRWVLVVYSLCMPMPLRGIDSTGGGTRGRKEDEEDGRTGEGRGGEGEEGRVATDASSSIAIDCPRPLPPPPAISIRPATTRYS